MKKQLLIVEPHSVVDLITNSSTELFVMRTGDKDVDTVRNILEEKWRLFKLLYPNDYAGNPKEYDSFTEILEVRKATAEDAKSYDENWSDCYEKGMVKEGNVMIIGISDNSIPGDFFDVITNTFHDVETYHLG